MKFGINNPAWLQAAGNAQAEGCIICETFEGYSLRGSLSAIGDVRIVSTIDGSETTQVISSPDSQEFSVQPDANTQVFFYGKITEFRTSSGGLTTLNASGNTALKKLNCSENRLTTLDVSANTALIELNCRANQLTTLDVSANTALEKLDCRENRLTTLDVSADTALIELYCGANQLTTLDVSANTALKKLYCGANQLTTLDTSANTALIELECSENQLTTLDASANTALTGLYCNYNQLTTLNISANTALRELGCSDNETIRTILGIATNRDVAYYIASAITDATSADGTVTLRQGDEFNQTIIDAAMTKGWDVQYYQ